MQIEHATQADLPAIIAIERAGFNPAEAGSPAAFKNRLQNIPETFLVAKDGNQVVGFIVGPVAATGEISDQLYEQVIPNPPRGNYLLVLSIAVAPAFRGQGVGSQLLTAFAKLARQYHCQAISLDSLANNVPFYEKNGFQQVGVSSSEHANETWFNLQKSV